jgi:hypothetical protein
MIREVDKALDYLRGGELERTEGLVVLGSPSDSSGLIMSRVCLDLAPTYAMWGAPTNNRSRCCILILVVLKKYLLGPEGHR